jgi:hypothetical protein
MGHLQGSRRNRRAVKERAWLWVAREDLQVFTVGALLHSLDR